LGPRHEAINRNAVVERYANINATICCILISTPCDRCCGKVSTFYLGFTEVADQRTKGYRKNNNSQWIVYLA